MTIPENVVLWVLTGIMGLLAYFLRDQKKNQDEKNKAYDQHLKDCGERNEKAAREDGVMETKIRAIEEWAQETKDKVDWLCESMAAIAVKVKANVPKLKKASPAE